MVQGMSTPTGPVRHPSPALPRISVSATDDTLVVALMGPLDDDAVPMLLEVVEAAIAAKARDQQVEVDLRDGRSCSRPTLDVLRTCVGLGVRVRGAPARSPTRNR